MNRDALPPVRRCLLRRRDYGYPFFPPCGWPVRDLLWEPLPDFAGSEPGLVLRNAEVLLGWARSRAAGSLFDDLARFARRHGLVLECRFPRPARALQEALTRAGAAPEWDDLPPDGSVPPLYARLPPGSPLIRLHLELEWRTGLGAARGGVALLRTGALLALRPHKAPEVAKGLGVSAGAARSYLSWMEDAALARREGGTFALRHPLLASLWTQPGPKTGSDLSAPLRPMVWDPVELD